MNTITFTAIAIAMLSVLAVMILGVISMIKGGEFNKKYGNRLMKARVYLQGLTLALLALAFFSAQS